MQPPDRFPPAGYVSPARAAGTKARELVRHGIVDARAAAAKSWP